MITLYSGTPGSGKSLHATRDIRDALKYKRQYVIANYDMVIADDCEQNFTYCPNDLLRPTLLKRCAQSLWTVQDFRENGLLLVIDEAQLLFNSRSWREADRMEWIEFFSQHRKYGYDVVLIAQSDVMIDKQFRELLEYEVNHRKVGNYGLWGKTISIFALGNLFYACRYYYVGHTKIDGEFFRATKKVMSMYDSYVSFAQVARDSA